MPERPAAKRATALGARPVVRYFSESSYDLTHSNPRAGARRVTMGSHYGHGYRSDYGIGGGYGEPQRRGWRADRPSDPLDVIWRYSKTFIPELAKRQQSEKPLRDWFTMDHNSNVLIERKDDSVESSVATQYQKICRASDRRGTRDDEFDGRDDARDRQRASPRQRGAESSRVVVVRSHDAPASYETRAIRRHRWRRPRRTPSASSLSRCRRTGASAGEPPRPRVGCARGTAGRQPAAAPFYPSAGRAGAAPMGRSYAAAGARPRWRPRRRWRRWRPKRRRWRRGVPSSAGGVAAPVCRRRAHNPPPPSSHAPLRRSTAGTTCTTPTATTTATPTPRRTAEEESLAREADQRGVRGTRQGFSRRGERGGGLLVRVAEPARLAGRAFVAGHKPVVSRAPRAAGTATRARVSGI